jgi:hypothetical protein
MIDLPPAGDFGHTWIGVAARSFATWRDLLGGARRSLDDGLPLARVLDAYGLAVLERVG